MIQKLYDFVPYYSKYGFDIDCDHHNKVHIKKHRTEDVYMLRWKQSFKKFYYAMLPKHITQKGMYTVCELKIICEPVIGFRTLITTNPKYKKNLLSSVNYLN